LFIRRQGCSRGAVVRALRCLPPGSGFESGLCLCLWNLFPLADITLDLSISERRFIIENRFITFGGRSAQLAYHVEKSGRKTSIIIIIIISFGRYPG